MENVPVKYKHLSIRNGEQKTDLCLFYRGDTTPISITLNNQVIKSNKTINVLGVIFDSKLQWADHLAHAITKSFNALNAIRLIKKIFTQKIFFSTYSVHLLIVSLWLFETEKLFIMMHWNEVLHQFAHDWLFDLASADSSMNLAWGRTLLIFSKLSPRTMIQSILMGKMAFKQNRNFSFQLPRDSSVKTLWRFLINYYYSLWANLSKHKTRKYLGRNLLRYMVTCQVLYS